MDGGSWWAAIYGVAQSWTQLKRLSNSATAVYRGAFYNQRALLGSFSGVLKLLLWMGVGFCRTKADFQGLKYLVV